MAKKPEVRKASIKNISIRYEKLPNYSRFHVTNFTGTLTPNGQTVSIELSEDVPSLPEKVNIKIDEVENVATESFTSHSDKFVRYVHAGITIPMDALPKLIAWLQTKVDDYKILLETAAKEGIQIDDRTDHNE